LILKMQGLTFVAAWDWWWVLSPFGLAVIWWTWADKSGYYARRQMEKMDSRKKARIERHRSDLRKPPERRS
jgi:small Trp-rich protein